MSEQQPDLTDVRITLARMEERQEANLHKLRNIDMKVEALAAKTVEKEDLLPLVKRVSDLENAQRWVTRTILVGLTGIAAGAVYAGKKIGLGP